MRQTSADSRTGGSGLGCTSKNGLSMSQLYTRPERGDDDDDDNDDDDDDDCDGAFCVGNICVAGPLMCLLGCLEGLLRGK